MFDRTELMTKFRAMRDAGNRADASFVEAGTLPYLTRWHGDDTVAITTRATRLPSGVLPLRNHDHALTVHHRNDGNT